MGNEWSQPDSEEQQDGVLSENDSEFAVNVKNGPVTQQSNPGVNVFKENGQADSKQITREENVITSSQKTIVFSPISNGINVNQPPAQSKYRMTISRPSPGRATFEANGLDVGGGNPKTVVSDTPTTQASNGNAIIVQTNASGTLNQASPSTQEASLAMSDPNREEGPKPKEISLFQRLFMPEKKVQFEVPVQNEEEGITAEQKPGLQSAPPAFNLSLENVDESMQEPAQVLSSDTATKRDADTQTVSEGTQTTPTEEVHPIMSFFKTLVSPNKPAPKSEEEAKNEGDEKKKDNGGLRKTSTKKEKSKSFSEQTLEADAKGSKKSDSPKSRTLSRLFRQKSKKEEQQASGNKISTQASKDDGKATKESAPRPRPFWRKASAEPDVQVQKANTDATAAGSGTKTATSQDKAKKTEDGKNAKPKLMTFFKQLTLDITDGVEVTKSEKTVVSAVIETPAPKNKEHMKEKKASAEKIAKQDSRESPEATGSIQLQMPEASVVVNGSDAARESQLKRTEKRQSLGSFFKAIGPKRMCDAEVQTDPVSILPAEKVK